MTITSPAAQPQETRWTGFRASARSSRSTKPPCGELMPASEQGGAAATSSVASALSRWATEPEGGGALISRNEADCFAALLASLGVGYDSCYAECRLADARQLDLLLSYGRNSAHM